jgi:hypothetical protein
VIAVHGPALHRPDRTEEAAVGAVLGVVPGDRHPAVVDGRDALDHSAPGLARIGEHDQVTGPDSPCPQDEEAVAGK